MATVFDVANYILQKKGPISAMKLQKLVYYSQAWSLVWDDEPLFNEPIEAWMSGPVVRSLYEIHRGSFTVSQFHLQQYRKTNELTDSQKETVDSVLQGYGEKSAQWLSDLTHSEPPWKEARIGLSENERGDNVISLATMSEYYSSIQ